MYKCWNERSPTGHSLTGPTINTDDDMRVQPILGTHTDLRIISRAIIDTRETDVQFLRNRMDNTSTETSRSIQGLQPQVEAISVFDRLHTFILQQQVLTQQLEGGSDTISLQNFNGRRTNTRNLHTNSQPDESGSNRSMLCQWRNLPRPSFH